MLMNDCNYIKYIKFAFMYCSPISCIYESRLISVDTLPSSYCIDACRMHLYDRDRISSKTRDIVGTISRIL